MSSSPPTLGTPDGHAAVPSRTTTAVYPGTPRWVKASGIIVLVLILVFAGVHVASGGIGPGAHLAHVTGH